MRKLGIEVFFWLDNWNDNQTSVFKRVRECGYNAAEISLVSGPNIDIDRYRNALAEYDLQVYCSMGLPADQDITSEDEAMRRSGIDYLKQCVETAAALGSPALGGLPYVPWLYFPDTNDLQPYRDRAAAAIREVGDVAADQGIVICLEIINRFETFMFNTAEEGLTFLQQVDHPAVKLQLDTYHMNMEEDNIADAIRAAGDHLGHFHCAASNRKLPGKGHIDWSAIRTALDDINYQGGVVLETFPNPSAETGRTINVWRPLVSDFDTEATEAAQFIHQALIQG